MVAFMAGAGCLVAFAAAAAPLPPNLALSARATATSEYGDQYRARFAVDGKIPAAGLRDDAGSAWCVRGETHRHGAELSLEWTNAVTVAEVVYHGRTAWFAEECWKDYQVLAEGSDAPAAAGVVLAGTPEQHSQVLQHENFLPPLLELLVHSSFLELHP